MTVTISTFETLPIFVSSIGITNACKDTLRTHNLTTSSRKMRDKTVGCGPRSICIIDGGRSARPVIPTRVPSSPSTSRGVPARRSARSCQTGACWLVDASATRSWAAMCTSTAARSSRTRSFLLTARSAATCGSGGPSWTSMWPCLTGRQSAMTWITIVGSITVPRAALSWWKGTRPARDGRGKSAGR
jgi:hypothetical protein